MVILRTDAGHVIGQFKNTRIAVAFADALPVEKLRSVLIIQSKDGVVLCRRWPDDAR